MANKCSGFVVRCFKRSSGAPAWLVSGTIAGRQIRREFSSREDALSYAEEQNSQMHGRQPDQAPRLTRLTLPELRDAESVCKRLSERYPGVSLQDVFRHYETLTAIIPPDKAPELAAAALRLKEKFPDVSVAHAADYFSTNYRPPKSAVTLKIALENYLHDVSRRQTTGSLSISQQDSIEKEMSRFEKHFGVTRLMADIGTSDLQEYLRTTTGGDGSKTYSNKTWSNRRGYLTTLWKYCISENWLDHNAAQGVKNFSRRDLPAVEPVILHAPEAKRLMMYLENNYEGRLVPFFTLCMFGGIRPDWQRGEISRLTSDQIDIKNGIIHLRRTDTKTRRARQVKLQDNLQAWLKAYPLDKYPILCTNFKKLLNKMRGEFKLGHDVLRHTYCTMLVAKYRSVGDAALQAGNSENVIWSNYLNLVPQTEAEGFWGIVPTKSASGSLPA